MLIGRAFLFLLLTLFTQIGGIVYLITLAGFKVIDRNISGRKAAAMAKFSSFILFYLISTFLILPLLAKPFGRVPLSITIRHHLKPLTVWTCLLNRNYVRPELKNLAEQVAMEMDKKFPGTVTHYLDANFPFINKFPLPPHLSHNDGKKLDLAFCYLDSKTGTQTSGVPSPLDMTSPRSAIIFMLARPLHITLAHNASKDPKNPQKSLHKPGTAITFVLTLINNFQPVPNLLEIPSL